MKGEYLDQQQQHQQQHQSKNNESLNMFSKLHHHHHNNNKYSLHPHPHHVPFQVPARDSEDDDSAATQKPASADGATIEVVRRPRGRPPGSKNKPKPPVVITRDAEPAMSPYILEVPGGNDVVEAITRFCRKKSIGLCVLTGSGTVANVTLRQPSASTAGGTVTFHGRFDILSVSATVLPPAPPCPAVPGGFTISLAGPQGQIVGGAVAGPLLAAGTVYVIAATFNSPSYHRLPVEEELSAGSPVEQQPGEPVVGGGMYGCHVPPGDVIWAPTPRQPPPPPY